MASATISPYYNNTTTQAFALASEGENKCKYVVAGRPLNQPWSIEIERIISAPSSRGNDRVLVTQTRVEPNSEAGTLATMRIQTSLSIPKDQTVLSLSVQEQMIGVMASVLNEFAAVSSSVTNREKLLTGINL